MSGATLRMFIAFGGIIAVFWAAQHVANIDNNDASVDLAESKEQVLKAKSRILHTEKAHGPLTSEINLTGAATNSVGEALVLEGIVTSTKEVKNAKVKWILPANVILVSGTADEVIVPEISPQQPYYAQITVEQKDLSNKQIHFIASGQQPGLHFSSVAQYNTKNEEFLEEQKDLVIKTLNAQKQEHKKAAHLFH